MGNRFLVFGFMIAALEMTGCKWDDGLYEKYVNEDDVITVTRCPAQCEDLSGKAYDLNPDGSCDEGMKRVSYEEGRLTRISFGDGKFLRINYNQEGQVSGVEGVIRYSDSGVEDVFVPTPDQIAMAKDAAQDELCPRDYHACQRVPGEAASFMCRATKGCSSSRPMECIFAGQEAYCADLTSDEDNCGACGARCDLGFTCVNGVCDFYCETGLTRCNVSDNEKPEYICVDSADVHMTGCGTCDAGYNNCDKFLYNGCETNFGDMHLQSCDACAEGYGNCDRSMANGCEIHLPSVMMNTCDECMPGYADCDNSILNGCEVKLDSINLSACQTCQEGYANCDGNWDNGCEVNLSSLNLDACGQCAAGFGNCDNNMVNGCEVKFDDVHLSSCEVCIEGYDDCDNNRANGCETRVSNDPLHCGKCETECSVAPNYFCQGSKCISSCRDGYVPVEVESHEGAPKSCVDTKNDVNFCGAQMTNCEAKVSSSANVLTALCAQGKCMIGQCKAGFAAGSGDSCTLDYNNVELSIGCGINLQNDENHCGGCNVKCGEGQECRNGYCVDACAAGLTECTIDGKSVCVDLMRSPEHCGSCETKTYKNGICVDGNKACSDGWMVCDDACVDINNDPKNCGGCGEKVPANGVCDEGNPKCAEGWKECYTDQCVNIKNDKYNCGECQKTAPTNGICEDGKPNCAVGLTNCNGVCVDLTTDLNNCGECGQEVYKNGLCVNKNKVCPEGWEACDNVCTNTKVDVNNCGACGKKCGEDEYCYVGSDGKGSCYGRCLSTDIECLDGDNHKICLNKDALHIDSCVGSELKCVSGYDNCDKNIYNGCESNLSSKDSCGKCGVVCPTDAKCLDNGGTYSCSCTNSSEIICDGKCIDPETDMTYCGATAAGCTNKACTGGAVCSEGECVCPESTVKCGETCVDPKTSEACCGTTLDYKACVDNQICFDGQCRVVGCNTNECPYVEEGVIQCRQNTNAHSCGSKCNNCYLSKYIEEASCDSGECNIKKCVKGYHLDQNQCVEDTPSACGSAAKNCMTEESVSAANCNNGECKITGCIAGYYLVDSKCVSISDEDCNGKDCTKCEGVGDCHEAVCSLSNGSPKCSATSCNNDKSLKYNKENKVYTCSD